MIIVLNLLLLFIFIALLNIAIKLDVIFRLLDRNFHDFLYEGEGWVAWGAEEKTKKAERLCNVCAKYVRHSDRNCPKWKDRSNNENTCEIYWAYRVY